MTRQMIFQWLPYLCILKCSKMNQTYLKGLEFSSHMHQNNLEFAILCNVSAPSSPANESSRS